MHAGTLEDARAACMRGAAHAEVALRGTAYGSRQNRGSHERIFVIPSTGKWQTERVLRIEDNTDITGSIPLRDGEVIEIQGQYECNDGVIHWTHHDPRGRHVGGYIKVNGRTYQ